MRCFWIFFADHAHNFRQFLHQICAILQPSGGINQQQISTIGLRLRHRVKGQTGRIRAFWGREHRNTSPLTPNLQLFHCGSAKRIARSNHHRFARRFELAGQFSNRGGFARAIHADHQYHLRGL